MREKSRSQVRMSRVRSVASEPRDGRAAFSLTWLTLLLVTLPLPSEAQSCATPPARIQPPIVFNCVGGICINSGGDSAAANCPVAAGSMGGGTPAQFYTCSVANYTADLVHYFGPLAFAGTRVTRTPTARGEVVNIQFTWQSARNGKYTAILQSVRPRDPCPSYWVVAEPPPHTATLGGRSVAQSIDPATGNVHWTATDVDFAGTPGSLQFHRFYSTADVEGLDGVPGWRHSFSRRIETLYQRQGPAYPGKSSRVSARFSTPAEACTSGFADIRAAVPAWKAATPTFGNGVCVLTRGSVTIATLPILSFPVPEAPARPIEYDLVRDDGQVLRYTLQDGPRPQPGVSMRLAITAIGFTVIDDENTVEAYDGAGVLQSVTSRAGLVQRVSHDASGRLSGVSDSSGHALTVSRNEHGAIAGITVTGGKSLQYRYDDFSRLFTVTGLDGKTNTYVYDDPLFFNALTSVVDSAGAILAHWAYDSHERATTTYGRDGAGAAAYAYADDGPALTVTDAGGAVRRLHYERIGDIDQVVVPTE